MTLKWTLPALHVAVAFSRRAIITRRIKSMRRSCCVHESNVCNWNKFVFDFVLIESNIYGHIHETFYIRSMQLVWCACVNARTNRLPNCGFSSQRACDKWNWKKWPLTMWRQQQMTHRFQKQKPYTQLDGAQHNCKYRWLYDPRKCFCYIKRPAISEWELRPFEKNARTSNDNKMCFITMCVLIKRNILLAFFSWIWP